MLNFLLTSEILTNTAEELGWWDSLVAAFFDQWWAFFIGLVAILLVLLLISILSKGKIFKLRRVVKIGINAVLGFVLLFIFNLVASLFGAALEPAWWNWLIIGAFGVPGTILCIVLHFIL